MTEKYKRKAIVLKLMFDESGKSIGESIQWYEDHSNDFKDLQKIVGGYLELVRVPKEALRLLEKRIKAKGFKMPDTTVMFVNEEGLLQKLPRNHTATLLAGTDIVGNVILIDAKVVNGE